MKNILYKARIKRLIQKVDKAYTMEEPLITKKSFYAALYSLTLLLIPFLCGFWAVMYYFGYLQAFNVISPETLFSLYDFPSLFSGLLATFRFTEGTAIGHGLLILLFLSPHILWWTVCTILIFPNAFRSIRIYFSSQKKRESSRLIQLLLTWFLPIFFILFMSCLPWIIENKGQHAGKSIGLQNKQAFIQKSLQCLPTDHLETIEYVQGNKNIEADCSVYIFAGNDYRLYLRKNTMLLIAKPNTLVSSWSID